LNHFIGAITAAAVVAVSCASFASAQEEKSVKVPAAQRALSSIVSKYSELYDAAPNEIQQDRALSEFRKAFCVRLAGGVVADWIGEVNIVNDYTPNKGIHLDLTVSTANLNPSSSGALGIGLWLGNSDTAASMPVGSPLYKAASTLRTGDTVAFSGSFVSLSAPAACTNSLRTSTDFSFRFSAIRKIGSDLALE
jgi:hypothetical protein